MGLTWLSTIPLTGSLVATSVGPQYTAMLCRFVFMNHQLGAFCGSWLGGVASFDATGSYTVMWCANAALCFVAAAMHWAIVERPVGRLVGGRACRVRAPLSFST